jgi:hypothetical protein
VIESKPDFEIPPRILRLQLAVCEMMLRSGPELVPRDVRGGELALQAQQDTGVEVVDDDAEAVREVVEFGCFAADLAVDR